MLPRWVSVIATTFLLTLPVFAHCAEAGAPEPGGVADTESTDIQTADNEADIETTHDELRILRDGLVRAVNDQDVDALLPLLHPDIVVTWQNAEVSRGRDGVLEYYQRMMEGPAAILKNFEFAVEPEDLTILYRGDAGVAFGNSTEKFELTRGLTFEHHGRWSATLVRHDGKWLLANYHASTNLFDNPLLAIAQRTTVWVGVGAFLIGGLVGWLVLGRRKRSTG